LSEQQAGQYSANCFQANKPIYLVTVPRKTRDGDNDDLDERACKKKKLKDYKDKDDKYKDKDKNFYRDLGGMVKNVNKNQD
jgi:hypothetical protein